MYRNSEQYEKMNLFNAVDRVEITGSLGFDDEAILTAWQWLHDSGSAYQLQGWYGKEAQRLIQQGLIEA